MSPQAEAQLARWGLTPDDAIAAGIFETPDAGVIFPSMDRAAGLVIPYFDPMTCLLAQYVQDGVAMPYARVRWLQPRAPGHGFVKAKPIRYAQPPRSGVRAYFPPDPQWPDVLTDVRTPIVLTEGEAKALRARKDGFACIAFGGVYSFVDRGGALLPELAATAWEGRDVYIAYDSDAETNPQVLAAEARLAEELQRQRGARVRIVRIPPGDGDVKQGLDDFLISNGPAAFAELARAAPNLSALDIKILALNKRCAWIERDAAIWDLQQRCFIRKDAFISGSALSTGLHTVATPRGTKEISVSGAWLRHPYAQRFGDVLLRPGEGVSVAGDNGMPALNLWQGWRDEPGDVGPFLELNAHVTRNMRAEDRDLPMKLLAYKAQNPEIKVPLALVMIGKQGGGKSLWAEIVGEAFEPNASMLNAEQLTSKYSDWKERAIIAVVDEVDATTFVGKQEQIRALISQLRQPMEVKYRPVREVNCYTFFIINSNNRSVGSFGADDRRMIVIDTPAPREKEFYDRIKEWRKRRGARRLIHYLLQWDLKGWQPPQRAPQSDEKVMAYHEGLTPIQELAHDLQTADKHMFLIWLRAAEEWARRAELSNNTWVQAQGAAIMANINQMQIRPWYTPQELCMLFPSVIEQTQGARLNRAKSSGQISRELRDAGIPYLRNADNPAGFWVNGQQRQYLVIHEFDEWSRAITQDDFDRLMKSWATYGQHKQRR
jgi:hypothetical protein